MIRVEDIKKLREETGISLAECKKSLEEAKGDLELARKILREKGHYSAVKKREKETGQGVIASYIHQNKRIGVLLELRCETDFVARSPDFQNLAHELSLQIAAIDPREIPLLEQEWIKDQSKKIKDLIEEYIAKLGENIVVKRFERYQIF
jgi:elongation factor Ts